MKFKGTYDAGGVAALKTAKNFNQKHDVLFVIKKEKKTTVQHIHVQELYTA